MSATGQKMARSLLALLAAFALAVPVAAQEAGNEATPGGPAIAMVQGLSAGDLLNVRASASPMGAVMGRLPNGALVRRHECRMVEGYEWCRIAVIEGEGEGEDLAGWTPGRYLQFIEAMAEAEATPPAEEEAPSLPPGLDARFADAPAAPALLPDTPAAPALPSNADAATYLPALREALRARGAVIADIPCARHLGQPMTSCAARIVRIDGAAAEITVTWPDGGTRVISFRGGEPADSDAPDALHFTREGGLNLIRIGPSERFEITDGVAFGD